MPAHSRGSESVESYLTRVLAALCRQSNGEVRLKGATLDSVPGDEKISVDWDSAQQELVIRAITPYGEVYYVNGALAWKNPEAPPKPTVVTIPAPQNPPPQNFQPHDDKVRATTLDTERLVELENKMVKDRILARIRRDAEETQREMENLAPAPSSTASGRTS